MEDKSFQCWGCAHLYHEVGYTQFFNIGIKNDFLCTKVPQVPRDMLETVGKAWEVFKITGQRDLANIFVQK